MLVADDRVDVARVHTSLTCQAPEILKKKLEIRGLGIVDVTRMFGVNAFLNKINLDFVIKLVKFDELKETDRLNPINDKLTIMDLEVPMLTIPMTEGKSLSVIVESAVTDYLLKESGYDANELFKQEYREILKERSGVK